MELWINALLMLFIWKWFINSLVSQIKNMNGISSVLFRCPVWFWSAEKWYFVQQLYNSCIFAWEWYTWVFSELRGVVAFNLMVSWDCCVWVNVTNLWSSLTQRLRLNISWIIVCMCAWILMWAVCSERCSEVTAWWLGCDSSPHQLVSAADTLAVVSLSTPCQRRSRQLSQFHDDFLVPAG